MGKGCRHHRHEVEPQRLVWASGVIKRTLPAQVYCADCKSWLYEKPVDVSKIPVNAAQRREAHHDDTQSGQRPARQADRPGAPGR